MIYLMETHNEADIQTGVDCIRWCTEPLYWTFLAFPLPPPAPLCSLLHKLGTPLCPAAAFALSRTMQKGAELRSESCPEEVP